LLDQARFVVGCDGASSVVRQELGIGLVDLGYDEEWLVVDVLAHPGRAEHLPGIIQQVCDPHRPATFVPSHGRHRRWELQVTPGERPDPWALLAHWGIGPGDGELLRAVVYRFHALVAERWRGGPDGRVLLAGDAAHQMPPFMGQGMCSGMRDAANLAWRLDGVLRHGQPDALLDGYQAERRPHTEAVVALSIQAGRLIHDLAEDLAAGRPLRLPEPDRPDPDRWSRLPGLDLGEPFPVGHQLPQPDRLDDRLGLGWAVVASAPLDDEASRTAARVAGAWGDVPVVVEPRATYGRRALLVRPDRYVAASLA
jgi:3-(3-hydroxy-phenyl)propionate hydroxylase